MSPKAITRELRDLDSPDAKKRSDALDRLWGALCNQGSVEIESLDAVPALVATLASPRARSRAGVIELCIGIAIGDHSNFLDGALAPNRPRKRPAKPARSIEGKCHEAVASRIEAFRALLDDRDSEVRAAAAFALAWFADPAKTSIVALRRRIEVERDPAVIASLLIALSHLGDDGSRASMHAAIAAKAEIVRGAAAIAIALLDRAKTKADIRAALESASQTKALRRTKQSWNGGDLAGHAKIVLQSLPASKRIAAPPNSEPWMIAKLETISYPKGQALAAEWVPKLFRGSVRRAAKKLSEMQRRFLTTLMTEGIGTPGSELDAQFRAHGLPTLERLPAWIGVRRGTHRDYRRRD